MSSDVREHWKKPRCAGLFSKRMKGLEPSTFGTPKREGILSSLHITGDGSGLKGISNRCGHKTPGRCPNEWGTTNIA